MSKKKDAPHREAGDRETFIVTGGCGFIGSNLVAELLRRRPGCRVVIVDDFRTGTFANLVAACDRAEVGPFAGSITPESIASLNWQPAVVGLEPRAVFHLAAITDTTLRDEAEMLRVNTEPFADILDACLEADVPLVYASSAAVYGSPAHGDSREPFPETAAGRPNNVYGFSKWLMERDHAARDADRARDGDKPGRVIGLRFFNVFGPGESAKGHMASMVHQLATRMLAGKPPRIFAGGDQARDQVPVADVVEGCLAAAGLGEKKKPTPGIYNMGSGRATSFNEIVTALREALDIPESRMPTEYFEMPEAIRAFYQEYTCADMTAAAEGLGWSPSIDPSAAMRSLALYLRDGVPAPAQAAGV